MSCTSYVISGRVQGVGFRWETRSKAAELGLTGGVRNNSDGTVQIFVCGDDWGLSEFKKWLDSGGPSYSKISEIEEEKYKPDQPPVNFVIL
ncbi:acylphosphatase [Patescibacteria group bacterium]|nr:acylphosphatase [Patescibacteria group bacterium]